VPEQVAFYMDEHVPKAVTEGLRRRGVDVLTAQEASMLHALDEQHLQLAADLGRVVFTQDTDFLRLHAAGVPHAGIVYAPSRHQSVLLYAASC
jgi:predicted nuclease of predicted toxin-antitoxin system